MKKKSLEELGRPLAKGAHPFGIGPRLPPRGLGRLPPLLSQLGLRAWIMD